MHQHFSYRLFFKCLFLMFCQFWSVGKRLYKRENYLLKVCGNGIKDANFCIFLCPAILNIWSKCTKSVNTLYLYLDRAEAKWSKKVLSFFNYLFELNWSISWPETFLHSLWVRGSFSLSSPALSIASVWTLCFNTVGM